MADPTIEAKIAMKFEGDAAPIKAMQDQVRALSGEIARLKKEMEGMTRATREMGRSAGARPGHGAAWQTGARVKPVSFSEPVRAAPRGPTSMARVQPGDSEEAFWARHGYGAAAVAQAPPREARFLRQPPSRARAGEAARGAVVSHRDTAEDIARAKAELGEYQAARPPRAAGAAAQATTGFRTANQMSKAELQRRMRIAGEGSFGSPAEIAAAQAEAVKQITERGRTKVAGSISELVTRGISEGMNRADFKTASRRLTTQLAKDFQKQLISEGMSEKEAKEFSKTASEAWSETLGDDFRKAGGGMKKAMRETGHAAEEAAEHAKRSWIGMFAEVAVAGVAAWETVGEAIMSTVEMARERKVEAGGVTAMLQMSGSVRGRQAAEHVTHEAEALSVKLNKDLGYSVDIFNEMLLSWAKTGQSTAAESEKWRRQIADRAAAMQVSPEEEARYAVESSQAGGEAAMQYVLRFFGGDEREMARRTGQGKETMAAQFQANRFNAQWIRQQQDFYIKQAEGVEGEAARREKIMGDTERAASEATQLQVEIGEKNRATADKMAGATAEFLTGVREFVVGMSSSSIMILEAAAMLTTGLVGLKVGGYLLRGGFLRNAERVAEKVAHAAGHGAAGAAAGPAGRLSGMVGGAEVAAGAGAAGAGAAARGGLLRGGLRGAARFAGPIGIGLTLYDLYSNRKYLSSPKFKDDIYSSLRTVGKIEHEAWQTAVKPFLMEVGKQEHAFVDWMTSGRMKDSLYRGLKDLGKAEHDFANNVFLPIINDIGTALGNEWTKEWNELIELNKANVDRWGTALADEWNKEWAEVKRLNLENWEQIKAWWANPGSLVTTPSESPADAAAAAAAGEVGALPDVGGIGTGLDPTTSMPTPTTVEPPPTAQEIEDATREGTHAGVSEALDEHAPAAAEHAPAAAANGHGAPEGAHGADAAHGAPDAAHGAPAANGLSPRGPNWPGLTHGGFEGPQGIEYPPGFPGGPPALGATTPPPAHGAAPAHRRHGGPGGKGKPYLVGEGGPELFVPERDGMILPHGSFVPRQAGGPVMAGGERSASSTAASSMQLNRSLTITTHYLTSFTIALQEAIDALKKISSGKGGAQGGGGGTPVGAPTYTPAPFPEGGGTTGGGTTGGGESATSGESARAQRSQPPTSTWRCRARLPWQAAARWQARPSRAPSGRPCRSPTPTSPTPWSTPLPARRACRIRRASMR